MKLSNEVNRKMKTLLLILAILSLLPLGTRAQGSSESEAKKTSKFIEYWVAETLLDNLVKESDPHFDHYARRFYHQAFYYWLATRGPGKWLDPIPRVDRIVLEVGQMESYRDRIRDNWDPAELIGVDRTETGELLQSGLRDPGESWMPGVTLDELGDQETYRGLVRKFREDLLALPAPTTSIDSK